MVQDTGKSKRKAKVKERKVKAKEKVKKVRDLDRKHQRKDKKVSATKVYQFVKLGFQIIVL